MIQPPCRQTCPIRTPECHSTCMRYKIYAIYMAKKREERQQAFREDADVTLMNGITRSMAMQERRKRH